MHAWILYYIPILSSEHLSPPDCFMSILQPLHIIPAVSNAIAKVLMGSICSMQPYKCSSPVYFFISGMALKYNCSYINSNTNRYIDNDNNNSNNDSDI